MSSPLPFLAMVTATHVLLPPKQHRGYSDDTAVTPLHCTWDQDGPLAHISNLPAQPDTHQGTRDHSTVADSAILPRAALTCLPRCVWLRGLRCAELIMQLQAETWVSSLLRQSPWYPVRRHPSVCSSLSQPAPLTFRCGQLG